MGSFGFPFFTSAGPRRAPVRMQMLSVGTTPRDFIEALVESLRLFVNGRVESDWFHPHHHIPLSYPLGDKFVEGTDD